MPGVPVASHDVIFEFFAGRVATSAYYNTFPGAEMFLTFQDGADVFGVFGELRIPIVEEAAFAEALNLEIGGRFDYAAEDFPCSRR